MIFKFWGDNLDQKHGVHDVQSDRHGSMVRMYSMLAGYNSCTPITTYRPSSSTLIFKKVFLPSVDDVQAVKHNLVMIH